MKKIVNTALSAQRKQYINPKVEIMCCSGTAVMLGASGDIHGNPVEESQSGNRAPERVF